MLGRKCVLLALQQLEKDQHLYSFGCFGFPTRSAFENCFSSTIKCCAIIWEHVILISCPFSVITANKYRQCSVTAFWPTINHRKTVIQFSYNQLSVEQSSSAHHSPADKLSRFEWFECFGNCVCTVDQINVICSEDADRHSDVREVRLKLPNDVYVDRWHKCQHSTVLYQDFKYNWTEICWRTAV